MKVAIENLAGVHASDKVLLLGGMMELGENSIEEHQEIVRLIDQHKWKEVVLVGGDFSNVNHKYHFFNNSAEAKEWLKHQRLDNAYLLIKGSRSMQMEKVLE
jgi:UDP-N-acetylmuramoyl-tripeptide--D-alanyl-D-alanine ligase